VRRELRRVRQPLQYFSTLLWTWAIAVLTAALSARVNETVRE
jgi:hypothetical protein